MGGAAAGAGMQPSAPATAAGSAAGSTAAAGAEGAAIWVEATAAAAALSRWLSRSATRPRSPACWCTRLRGPARNSCRTRSRSTEVNNELERQLTTTNDAPLPRFARQ